MEEEERGEGGAGESARLDVPKYLAHVRKSWRLDFRD